MSEFVDGPEIFVDAMEGVPRALDRLLRILASACRRMDAQHCLIDFEFLSGKTLLVLGRMDEPSTSLVG